jgi:surface protein
VTPAPTSFDGAFGDESIRTAVTAWLADATAAEATYGHISTWETSEVTDMSYLFSACDWDSKCNSAAASFNEDIGAWDTSGVTDMEGMFSEATSFDQDLGWCVGDDVFHPFEDGSRLQDAFENTQCESTSCGVVRGRSEGGICVTPAPTSFDGALGDVSIRTAVRAWIEDRAAAEATYGHISTWDTSGVTDMLELFADSSFNEDISAWDTSGVTRMDGMFRAASAFNQDIGAWDTSGVTTMAGMFFMALVFDQDIGDWDTSGVTGMQYMFYYASAFDQDLGWCVDKDVYLDEAFYNTPCASTSCGVKQVAGGCAPTPAPTTPAPTPTPIVDAAHRLSGVSAALLVLALAA